MLLTYKENVHSTQMYIPLNPLFSRHKGIGVQFSDEPTGNLDTENTRDIMKLLRESNEVYRQTMILITHDREIAMQADRILEIQDGRLVRDEVIR